MLLITEPIRETTKLSTKLMSDNNQENVNSSNDEQNVEEEIILPKEGEEEETDDVEVLKERLKQRNEAAAQLFARAKKAEGFELKEGKWIKKPAKPYEAKPAAPAKKINDEDVAKKIAEVLDQRDLEAMDLSDELKSEVSDLAKLKGISVKKALNDNYIKFRLEQDGKTSKADNASLPSGRKFSTPVAPEKITADPRTEDGKKAIEERNKKLREALG